MDRLVRASLAVMAVAVGLAVFGADVQWTGAAGDGNWHTPGNWSGGNAPAAGDTAVFRDSVTIAQPVVLPGFTAIAVDSGKTLKLVGNVSGDGSLVASGLGTVELSGENSFTGDFIHSNGIVKAMSPKALGSDVSGKVYIYISSNASKFQFAGVETGREIHSYNTLNFTGKDTGVYNLSIAGGTVNVFNGKWVQEVQYLRGRMGENAKAHINAGLFWAEGNASVSDFFQLAKGAEMIFSNVPVTITAQWGCNLESGMNVFRVAGNTLKDLSSASQNVYGSVRAEVENAFTQDSSVNQTMYSFDLGGFDQQLGKIFGRAASDNSVIKSAEPATLTLHDSGDWEITSRVEGAAGLMVLGESGTVTMSGASTSTGTLTVGSGRTVVVTEAGKWSGSVAVGEGARLEINAAGSLGADSVVEIAQTGKFKLALAGSIQVKDILVGGARLTPNRIYSGEAGEGVDEVLEQLEGAARFFVVDDSAATAFRRIGGGGDFADAGKWDANPAAAPAPGLRSFTFPSGGGTVNVAAVEKVNAMKFEGGPEEWRFEGSGGFEVESGAKWEVERSEADGAKARTVTFAAPVRMTAGVQEWRIDQNGNYRDDAPHRTEVKIERGLQLSAGAEWRISGGGRLALTGNARLDGLVNVNTARLEVANATIDCDGDLPLQVWSYSDPMQPPSGMLVLSNATINKTVEIVGNNATYPLTVASGTTNTIAGKFNSSTQNRYWVGDNAELNINGGGDMGGLLIPKCGENSWIRINNKPVIGGNTSLYFETSDGRLEVNVQSNEFRMGMFCGVMRAGVDDPFSVKNSQFGNLKMGRHNGAAYYRGMLDLNGHRVTLRTLEAGKFTSAAADDSLRGEIRSEVPGGVVVLTEKYDANWKSDFTTDVKFTGYAGLRLTGGQTQRLTNENETDGDLELGAAAGSVVLEPGAAWRGSNRVVVAGGRLRLRDSMQLGKRAEVLVSGAGKLELDAGTRQRVRNLWIDGKRQPGGLYGAPGIAAPGVGLSQIEGGGVMEVIGMGGICIIVR